MWFSVKLPKKINPKNPKIKKTRTNKKQKKNPSKSNFFSQNPLQKNQMKTKSSWMNKRPRKKTQKKPKKNILNELKINPKRNPKKKPKKSEIFQKHIMFKKNMMCYCLKIHVFCDM